MVEWHTVSVADAMRYMIHHRLYASPRGHLVVDIRRDKQWWVLTYNSGGKRYVHGEKLLYYRSLK